MENWESMNRKTIIITGGTGVIGQEIVKLLAPENFTILILARNIKTIRNKSILGDVYCRRCDVTKAHDIESAIKYADEKLPPLCGLINCAGANFVNILEEYSLSEIQMIIDTNLTGTILMTKYAVPLLKQQRFGKIINISSQGGIDPQRNNIIYSAAKAGVIAFTKGLAKELAEFNIAVNCVCPGDIESSMMDRAIHDLSKIKRKTRTAVKNEIINSIPCGRFGYPNEIAEIVKELMCLKTQYLTGATVVIAGGRTCH